MRYVTMTDLTPEAVLDRAKAYFRRNTRMRLVEETGSFIAFEGDIGRATLTVDRKHGHTNVHAWTDRVVGLDVTDVTKRFLYTLRHE